MGSLVSNPSTMNNRRCHALSSQATQRDNFLKDKEKQAYL